MIKVCPISKMYLTFILTHNSRTELGWIELLISGLNHYGGMRAIEFSMLTLWARIHKRAFLLIYDIDQFMTRWH